MKAADEADFEAFVRERSRVLLRTAHLLTGDLGHAEDILQLTYERLARKWPTLTGDPEAYVRRSLVNASTDRWRRRSRRVDEDPGPLMDEGTNDDPHAGVDLRMDLLAALARLPARQRAVMVLRFLDDLPERDVADAPGCSVGTVKSTTHKALRRLREHHDDVDHQPVRSLR